MNSKNSINNKYIDEGDLMPEKTTLKVCVEETQGNVVMDVYLKDGELVFEMYDKFDESYSGGKLTADPNEFFENLKKILGK